MAKSRVKIEAVPELSEEQLEQSVKRYTEVVNESLKLEAEMNQRIDEVKASYEARINELANESKSLTKVIHAWAEKFKTRFEKKRSIEFLYGKIGFRMGSPKLSKDKGLTWDAAARIMKVMKGGNAFIRTKEELDKELLLAKREEPEVIMLMADVGLFVSQDETFFIEPKQEEVSL